MNHLQFDNKTPNEYSNNEKNNQIYLDLCKSIPTNVSIAWRNVRYEQFRFPFLGIRCFGSKIILNRLNGSFEYQRLNGILGPSGAGKTTLINCLSGNSTANLLQDSEIFMNRNERYLPRISFIEQHVNETIIGRLTVKEILQCAFLFKNGWKQRQQMSSHIESTIKDLLLDVAVLDRYFDHCSGGEQKRIAVAQELMSLEPPSFLFIDEPTTGLDSNAALLLMCCLRKLTIHFRMAVIVSIHTPSAEIVKLFHKLYIMAKGGVCIYSGSPELLSDNLKQQLNICLRDDQCPIEEYIKISCKGNI